MKKECEIVQDLLFGYSDGILNYSSKELVEEHFKKCTECNKILEDIEKDDKNKPEKKEIDYLKKIKKKINRKSGFILITTILLVILIIFNAVVFINYKNYAETVEIYLSDNVTQEQLSNIEKTIKEICDSAEITYYSKDHQLEKMKEKFADNANLLDGYGEGNNIFPASYTIRIKLNAIKELEEKVKEMPGVERIITHLEINPYTLVYFSFIGDLQ